MLSTSVLIYLATAVICTAIAMLLRRKEIPGIVTADVVVGFTGAWIGGALFGPVGPTYAAIPVGLSFLTAVCTLVIFEFVARITAAQEDRKADVLPLAGEAADYVQAAGPLNRVA